MLERWLGRRPWSRLAVIAVLGLAGCSGPTGGANEQHTPKRWPILKEKYATAIRNPHCYFWAVERTDGGMVRYAGNSLGLRFRLLPGCEVWSCPPKRSAR